MSRYQKGKTNLDYTEARDSEWQWHQLGHMQVCTSLESDNHASTPPISFLQAGCPSCRPTNRRHSVVLLRGRCQPMTGQLATRHIGNTPVKNTERGGNLFHGLDDGDSFAGAWRTEDEEWRWT